MPVSSSTALKVAVRDPSGSRSARRLRRDGNIPGIVYGGGQEPVAFQVPARELRLALAHAGAVIDLSLDDAAPTPVVVKELDRHPVSAATVHIDLLRVRLDVKIQATVVLELTGEDDSPGVTDGGTLEHVTRELTIEALPSEIPDTLEHDVSEMQIGDTLTLAELRPPASVELLDDPETVIATLTPPRLQDEDEDEIETETAVVGEAAAGDASEPPGDAGEAADAGGAAPPDTDAE